MKLALLPLVCAAFADDDDGENAVSRESAAPVEMAPFHGALQLDGDEGPEPYDEESLPSMWIGAADSGDMTRTPGPPPSWLAEGFDRNTGEFMAEEERDDCAE